jgi:hypothetical protein
MKHAPKLCKECQFISFPKDGLVNGRNISGDKQTPLLESLQTGRYSTISLMDGKIKEKVKSTLICTCLIRPNTISSPNNVGNFLMKDIRAFKLSGTILPRVLIRMKLIPKYFLKRFLLFIQKPIK